MHTKIDIMDKTIVFIQPENAVEIQAMQEFVKLFRTGDSAIVMAIETGSSPKAVTFRLSSGSKVSTVN